MPQGAPPPPPAQQGRPPTPGQVRRERRALVRAREDRIRDLGGLMLEMYKRDRLKPELFFEQCAELVSIEERIQELDGALAALTKRTMAEANRCTCGAPLVWGAHFCANCGRAVGEAAGRRLRPLRQPAAGRSHLLLQLRASCGAGRDELPERSGLAGADHRRPGLGRGGRTASRPTRLARPASRSATRRHRARSLPELRRRRTSPIRSTASSAGRGFRSRAARWRRWGPRGSSGRPGTPGTGSGLSCFCC